MKKRIVYEWDVETFTLDEHQDITEHAHVDDLLSIKQLMCDERLVLVRDVWAEDGSLESRSWAYVDRNKLLENFTEDDGTVIAKVPNRFHAELEKFVSQAFNPESMLLEMDGDISTLKEFIEVNTAADVEPVFESDIELLKCLKIGQTYSIYPFEIKRIA